MRVNRRFLYPGLFLVALGGVLAITQVVPIPAALITDALRLWPLALIALGAGIALRKTNVSLGAGMLGAAIPGLVLGGAISLAPRVADGCTVAAGPPGGSVTDSRGGSMARPGLIAIEASCGKLTINTRPGSLWNLDSTNQSGRAPRIQQSAESVSIEAVGTNPHEEPGPEEGHDLWGLTVPTDQMEGLVVDLQAGEADIDLAGAKPGNLNVTSSMSALSIDATGATLGDLSARLSFSAATIVLPSGNDMTVHIRASGSAVSLCVPEDVGLETTVHGTAGEVTFEGAPSGSFWRSDNFATATHHAEIDLTVSFGAIEINPIGGCS